jgi:lipopolysaccharide/colanic/teichoic acid biosynthesis glycosyltransferase
MKRVLDVSAALVLLAILAPVLLVVSMLIACSMGRPILFKQRRPGLHGHVFTLLKFRTMTDARASDGRQLPDAERLTRVGRLIRATSLDELPQLWNVLRGDMSLVGPRPLLLAYLDRYTPRQARRHEVRPGITGWAQVNGRNAISWEDKLEMDAWYVDHNSLALDLKILLLTLVRVVRRDGISQKDEATVSEFMGSQASDTERSPGEAV